MQVEAAGMEADIVYERCFSPADGLVSSHELLRPVKVLRIRLREDCPDLTKSLSARIFF